MSDLFTLFTTVNTLNQQPQQCNPFSCECARCQQKWQAEIHMSKSANRNATRIKRLRDQTRRDW